MDLGAPIIGADIKGLPVTLISDPTAKPTAAIVDPLPGTIPGIDKKPPVVVVYRNNTVVTIKNEIEDANTPQSKTATIVATIVVILVVLAGVGLGGYFWWRKRNNTNVEI